VLELLVWALPFSYGVFLNHYTSQHLFDGPQEFLLPLVGTLSSGIIYLTSVIIMPMIARHPHQRRNLMRFGVLLCFVSLLGAAFATQVWHLILTQGVLYSIGASKSERLLNEIIAHDGPCSTAILYFPVQVYLIEWFNKRIGLVRL
jgi:MFS family permease